MRNVRGRWRRGISSGCWSRAGTPRCTDRTCAPPAGAWKPGWLRTLRAPNLQLAVELTEAGRGIAEPLFQAEREAETARQRLTDVRRLPLRQTAAGDAVELQLGDGHYTIREAAYVIRLDGTTCLQLTDAGGIRRIKEGDPLQVASWYQACFDAGLPVIVQVNESRD